MYHWYKLIRNFWDNTGNSTGLVDGGGPPTGYDGADAIGTKMFLLGAIETAPLFGIPGIGMYIDSKSTFSIWMVAGLVVSIILCYLLRNQTPELPIHLKDKQAKDSSVDNFGKD